MRVKNLRLSLKYFNLVELFFNIWMISWCFFFLILLALSWLYGAIDWDSIYISPSSIFNLIYNKSQLFVLHTVYLVYFTSYIFHFDSFHKFKLFMLYRILFLKITYPIIDSWVSDELWSVEGYSIKLKSTSQNYFIINLEDFLL